MNPIEKKRTIALAALFQAANLVDRLATLGQVPPSAFDIMQASLFKFDVEDISDIYCDKELFPGNSLQQNLSVGFRVCKQVFEEGASNEYPHTIRYVMALIQLEKHFRKAPELQKKVREALQSMPVDQAQISELYLETLATLPFRIQVLGKMQHLQNIHNEQQVRTLLFSGLRAAMLWQQSGGRRWHFIFKKNAIVRNLQLLSP